MPAALAACALAGCSDKNNAQAEAEKTPSAIPVLVAQAVEKRMPLRLHAIGNVETVASVVMDLGERVMHIAPDVPSKVDYAPVALGETQPA